MLDAKRQELDGDVPVVRVLRRGPEESLGLGVGGIDGSGVRGLHRLVEVEGQGGVEEGVRAVGTDLGVIVPVGTHDVNGRLTRAVRQQLIDMRVGGVGVVVVILFLEGT
ncbi:hypothetical protein ACFSSF_17790 [Dietzia aerolata]|uniref:hypothetical protein n=1 Tax=Dietzia aerolata TaxID=595984 RepID=UPI00363800C0